MKKILRRINRGAVLFLVLLLGMLIYFIIQSGIDKKTHAELRSIATDFIADTAKHVIIPESMRASSESEMADIAELVESYKTARTGSWGRFYADNVQVRRFASAWLEQSLGTQVDYHTYILSSEPQIDNFDQFHVYRDQATLYITVTDTQTILTPSGEEILSVISFSEQLTFTREDGRWVVLRYLSPRFTDNLAGYAQQ